MNHPRSIGCQAVRQHLSAYRAGEIHPVLQRRIAHHIHECDSCYAFYRSDHAFERELRQLLTTPPSGDFGRVWQGIQRDLSRPSASTRPVGYALLVTALLLMLLVPMTFGRNGIAWATPPTPPSPRSQTVVLAQGRTTPSPVGEALSTFVNVETTISTPDAPYRTESSTILSLMTP